MLPQRLPIWTFAMRGTHRPAPTPSITRRSSCTQGPGREGRRAARWLDEMTQLGVK